MTDLTEKWKNGELEERQYFVRMAITDIVNKADYFCGEFYTIDEDYAFDDSEISEVLAPGPSYEEWQKLKEENRALAMGSFPMMLEAAKKIDKLKELLKECREEISDEIDDCTDPRIELFAKIDEVLK